MYSTITIARTTRSISNKTPPKTTASIAHQGNGELFLGLISATAVIPEVELVTYVWFNHDKNSAALKS